MGLLNCLPRARRVPVCDGAVALAVPVVTLGVLADLEAAVRDRSWDPWDVPPGALAPGADPAARWESLWYRAGDWPPGPFTELAAQAVPELDAILLFLLAVRPSGGTEADAAALAPLLSAWDWARVLAAAYDEHPGPLAARRIDRLGGVPLPAPCGADWAKDVAEWCREWKRLPSEAAALSLTEWRVVRGASADRDMYLRARPGESRAEAVARRRATRERATAAVDAWERGRDRSAATGGDDGDL